MDGSGTNWVKDTIDANFNGASSVYAADINGDGDMDVLGVSFNEIAWWESYPGTLNVSTISIDIDTLLAGGTSLNPKATVTNYGNSTVSFDVVCIIDDPGTYIDTMAVNNLAPGANRQITFSPQFTFATGTYTVTVNTQLTGDVNPDNDTLEIVIQTIGKDVSTTSIDMPSYVLPNTTLDPRATVTNHGAFIDSFYVTCIINDPGTYTSTDTIIDLPAYASVQDTFAPPFTFVSGSYTVTVYTQLTGDEHPENDTLIHTITIDDTPPEPFSLIAPEDSAMLSNPRPTFIWETSSDAVSGVEEYEVYIDDVLKQTVTDTTWTPTTNLQEGWRNWYIVAYDSVGNSRQSTETWSLFIDHTPPSVVTLISPANSAVLNNSTVNFIWNESTDALSGVEDYILQYALNNGFSSGLVTDTLVETTFTVALADTIWYWRVSARDSLSNQSTWSSIWNFEIDTQSPNAPTLVSPIGGIYSGDTLVTFEWTEVTKFASFSDHMPRVKRTTTDKGSERVLGSRSQVMYILQVDTLFDFASPFIVDTLDSTSTTTLLFEDFYYWQVMAYDLVGNSGPYAIDSFGVDITAPVIESTTVWNDTSFAGPFEIKTKVTDELAGVDAVRLFYRRDEDAMWFTVDMDLSGSPDWYVDFIPSVTNEDDTVRYYIRADDGLQPPPGNVATDPGGAPVNYYWFIAKLTGVMESGDIPGYFSFGLKNNPVKGKAVFSLSLPQAASITLRIYDVSGRLIDNLISEKKSAGYYEIPWTSPKSAGVYFYRLESPWGRKVGKLVIVR